MSRFQSIAVDEFCKAVEGRLWAKGGKYRVYFKTDKTASAYLDFDFDASVRETGLIEFDEQHGYISNSKLCVFSNCETQGSKWNANRAKQIKHELAQRISAATTHFEVCADWQDVL